MARRPPAHREPLKDFRDQHKQRDDQRREYFPNRQRRQDGDGHRKLHGHSPFQNILNRFVKNGIPANDGAKHPHKDKRQTKVHSCKPKRPRGHRDKPNSNDLPPVEMVFVLCIFCLGIRGSYCYRVASRFLENFRLALAVQHLDPRWRSLKTRQDLNYFK